MTGQDASFVNAAESQRSLWGPVGRDAPGPSENMDVFRGASMDGFTASPGRPSRPDPGDSACDNTKPFTNDAISADEV
jgi:hypothetical protein